MRLLILLPFAPRLDAASGGARVITQFLTEICSRYAVAILYFREENEPGADSFFRSRCERVEDVVRPASKRSLGARLTRYLHLIFSLLLQRPLWVSDWRSQSFAQEVKPLAREFQPDIIQAEFHIMGQYFSALKDIPARRVLVEHEPSARADLYLQNLPRVLQNWIKRMEKISWQRYERNVYSQVDAIVTFTEADRNSILETAGRTPIHIIAPGTDIPQDSLNPVGNLPLSLLFVGNFYHAPNVDAARWLVESIFPGVVKLLPETRLFIVGENPPQGLKQAARENITITGRVPTVIPYLEQASLVVAPLRLGGGMRIKILEALAAGKAVVTTSLAAEGLGVRDGEQLAIADTDREFIAHIVQLLRSPEDRLALAGRARVWAGQHLTWQASVQKYEALYQELLTRSIRSERQSITTISSKSPDHPLLP